MRVHSNRQPIRTSSVRYLARARRVGLGSSDSRVPELRPLAAKSIALFGLGCLGAPSAMEFARAGVGRLALVDHDEVDPATVVRWPRGLAMAGLLKADVIAEWIGTEYPYCKVRAFTHRIGGVRRVLDEAPDEAVLADVIKDTSLIYDATAELGVQHLLTDLARERQIPYVGVSGTYGAWGGKVFRFEPSRTQGCWLCYRKGCDDKSISEPPSDDSGVVQPRGCADPTFTGANFDMMQIAMAGVRTAVSTLCAGSAGGYPTVDWDVLHIALRDDKGKPIAPLFHEIRLPIHAGCEMCNGT